jgi:exodeoxyribonuclease VII large subunit
MEVVATGRLTTFPGQSKYQMNVEDIRPAGIGALMAMLEKRKARWRPRGSSLRSARSDPYLPEVIGVVTSPSGAVIRDILHRLRDRFPRKVLVWPVRCRANAAPPRWRPRSEGFNALSPGGPMPRPDLIIVARGGGSIEDLWGFNEEIVVRAAAAERHPADLGRGARDGYHADRLRRHRRAPTPTAAAEMAVPVRRTFLPGRPSRTPGLRAASRAAWISGASGSVTFRVACRARSGFSISRGSGWTIWANAFR